MSEVAMQQHGMFSWNELLTSDINKAKSFYAELMGWQLEDIDADGMDYTIAKTEGNEVAGLLKTPDEFSDMPPHWGAYITVDDVDRSIDKAVALGGKVIMPAKNMDVGRFAIIADPQGAHLGIIKYSTKE